MGLLLAWITDFFGPRVRKALYWAFTALFFLIYGSQLVYHHVFFSFYAISQLGFCLLYTSYEPYLMQNGFLMRTPRGRIATEAAYRHLGIPYRQSEADAKQLKLFENEKED